jgi:hypothetical protein
LFSDIDKKHHEEMILNNKNIHYHDWQNYIKNI